MNILFIYCTAYKSTCFSLPFVLILLLDDESAMTLYQRRMERTGHMRIRRDEGTRDELDGIDVELIAAVSDALAHPVRLALFRHIMQCNKNMEAVCTGDLVAYFDYAQATISQHMKRLVRSGIVDTHKVDKYTYYYANLGTLMRYINATKKFSVL